jgi:hypothetical protein
MISSMHARYGMHAHVLPVPSQLANATMAGWLLASESLSRMAWHVARCTLHASVAHTSWHSRWSSSASAVSSPVYLRTCVTVRVLPFL